MNVKGANLGYGLFAAEIFGKDGREEVMICSFAPLFTKRRALELLTRRHQTGFRFFTYFTDRDGKMARKLSSLVLTR